MKPMTEAETLAFLKECGGHLVVTAANEAALTALAAKGIVALTTEHKSHATRRTKKGHVGGYGLVTVITHAHAL